MGISETLVCGVPAVNAGNQGIHPVSLRTVFGSRCRKEGIGEKGPVEILHAGNLKEEVRVK